MATLLLHWDSYNEEYNESGYLHLWALTHYAHNRHLITIKTLSHLYDLLIYFISQDYFCLTLCLTHCLHVTQLPRSWQL